MANDNLLFAYGSLVTGSGAATIDRIMAKATIVGHGYIHGQLYDLGAYPGAILSTSPTDKVFGVVYQIEARSWQQLDAYEGFSEVASADSEFLRRRVKVHGTEDRTTLLTWIYVLNSRQRCGVRIPSGSYQNFLRDKTGA